MNNLLIYVIKFKRNNKKNKSILTKLLFKQIANG